jgi:hypothetical protein
MTTILVRQGSGDRQELAASVRGPVAAHSIDGEVLLTGLPFKK